MEEKKSTKKKLAKSSLAVIAFARLSVVWLAIIIILSLFELTYNGLVHQFPKNLAGVSLWALLNDLIFWLKCQIYLFAIYMVIYLFSRKVSNIVFSVFIVLMAVIQLSLTSYFTTSLVPLGADLYGYSIKEIKETVGASGISFVSIIGFVVILGGTIAALWGLAPRINIKKYLAIGVLFISFLFIVIGAQAMIGQASFKSDFDNNLVINKTDHFWMESYKHFFPEPNDVDIYADSYISDYSGSKKDKSGAFKYTDPQHYPFLHSDTAADVLSPFLKGNPTPPNIVIIVVEGLGRAFTNKGGYLGNFTPFIDSLSDKSLYWKNFLSEGGRTFAVLPSVLGSLPFAKNGFLELGEGMPKHLSLLSLLKYNGYHTSFYYGGDSNFDNMKSFLQKNATDEINDEKSFPAGSVRLPAPNGTSWGFNDKELFNHYLRTRDAKLTQPQLSVIMTVATHTPFIINEEDKYLNVFEQRMVKLGFNDAQKTEHRNYKLQYASVLYLDDCLRGFFNAYSKRSDYNNTIFLITGDHRMPEIPMSDKIDRYHVPLIVFSPMLKRTTAISSVSTHFDISPSLLAYLHHNYKTKGPSLVSWIGQGLDTNRDFENLHNYPLMQTKNDIVDFIMGEYHLNGNNLFKMNADLGEDPIQDDDKANQLKNAFDQFKKRNNQIITGNWIIPDSIHQHYNPVTR